MDIINVGNNYNLVSNETTETTPTYSVRDLTNMIALRLAEDIIEYRKGSRELDKQIELETNALHALAKVTEALN